MHVGAWLSSVGPSGGQPVHMVPQVEVIRAASVHCPVLGCTVARPAAARAPCLGVRRPHLNPGLLTFPAWMHWCAPQPSSAHPCPLASSACFVSVLPWDLNPEGGAVLLPRAIPSVANFCWGGHHGRKKGQGQGGGVWKAESGAPGAAPCSGKAGGAGHGQGRRAGGGGKCNQGRQAPPKATTWQAHGKGTTAWGRWLAGHKLAWSATMWLQKTASRTPLHYWRREIG